MNMRVSFSPLAEIIMLLVIAAVLLLGLNLAHGAKLPQAPKPPQAPALRVFKDDVKPSPKPNVVSPCSDRCVCGCNQGQVCQCQSIPTPNRVVSQLPQLPQFQSFTAPAPNFSQFIPNYNAPMYFSQGITPQYFSPQPSIRYISGCPGGVCR